MAEEFMPREWVQTIADLLVDIEYELHALGLWQAEPIAPAALRSQLPFAVDTMNFAQWLQFIFLPRMNWLIAQQQALPLNSALAPMAEQYFAELPLPGAALIGYLHRLDGLLTRAV